MEARGAAPGPAPAEGGGRESSLLLLALHPDPGPRTLAAAAAALPACDGERLLALAEEEGLTCLLAELLERAGATPEAWKGRLAASRRRAAAWQMGSDGVHGAVLDALAGAGFSPLVLKGPALAGMLYDPAWSRDHEDLDLLLAPGEAAAAAAALLPMGFLPLAEKPPLLARIERWFDGTTTLVRGDGPSVDLHQGLSKADFPTGLDEPGFRARAVPVTVCGRAARTLCPADLLLYLCVHGCKDLWRRRIWVSDIARLLARFPDIDGGGVAAAADRAGTRRALEVGLALAAAVTGAPPSHPALAAAAAGEEARALAGEVLAGGKWDPTTTSVRDRFEGKVLQVRFRERWVDRVGILLGAVVVPRRTDWEALPVPNWGVPLLFPFRPLRLAWKWGGRLLRGGR